MTEIRFLHGPDCMSGMAVACRSVKAPDDILAKWREGSFKVCAERPEVSWVEGKVSAYGYKECSEVFSSSR